MYWIEEIELLVLIFEFCLGVVGIGCMFCFFEILFKDLSSKKFAFGENVVFFSRLWSFGDLFKKSIFFAFGLRRLEITGDRFLDDRFSGLFLSNSDIFLFFEGVLGKTWEFRYLELLGVLGVSGDLFCLDRFFYFDLMLFFWIDFWELLFFYFMFFEIWRLILDLSVLSTLNF